MALAPATSATAKVTKAEGAKRSPVVDRLL